MLSVEKWSIWNLQMKYKCNWSLWALFKLIDKCHITYFIFICIDFYQSYNSFLDIMIEIIIEFSIFDISIFLFNYKKFKRKLFHLLKISLIFTIYLFFFLVKIKMDLSIFFYILISLYLLNFSFIHIFSFTNFFFISFSKYIFCYFLFTFLILY